VVPLKKGGTYPWSLDWLATMSNHGDGKISPSHCNNITKREPVVQTGENGVSSSNLTPKKRKSGHVKRSIGFIKRVARMPVND